MLEDAEGNRFRICEGYIKYYAFRMAILRFAVTAEDGNKAIYSLTLKEVLRAGLTIADATPGALALNGTGGAVAPGSGGGSMATPGVLAVVP